MNIYQFIFIIFFIYIVYNIKNEKNIINNCLSKDQFPKKTKICLDGEFTKLYEDYPRTYKIKTINNIPKANLVR